MTRKDGKLVLKIVSATLFAIGLCVGQSHSEQPLKLRDFPSSTPDGSPSIAAKHVAKDSEWVRKRYRDLAADLGGGVELKQVKLVFVGDSITQHLMGEKALGQAGYWNNEFGRPGEKNYALNLGVAGDRTENVLLRLLSEKEGGFGQLDNPEIQPEVIVLLVGINNTWNTNGDVATKVVEGQVAVIRKLQALRPAATIVVNSLMPTNDMYRNKSIVLKANRRLYGEVDKIDNVVWLDTYPAFVNSDGSQKADLFIDGVHPNEEGYKVWMGLLLPKLEQVRMLQRNET
ncbi:GDSL-type esterase/lipase family protein [Asticcacaulis sp. AC402]|uniref:GDSL-type esterase/lipase family protein n=1 Tax=Asticcacaulis sp. AC402 TaxID=1282361 RepID=UPI0004CE69B6|nr:GDSL-type esterase/lipase family protein [Asticcacaulis sp. AC402]